MAVEERARGRKETLFHLTTRYVTERARRGQLVRQTSAASYRDVLQRFARIVGYDQLPARVTRRTIELYLEEGGQSARYQRGRISMVRGFFDWCIENGYAKTNPTAGLKGPKEPRPPRFVLCCHLPSPLLG